MLRLIIYSDTEEESLAIVDDLFLINEYLILLKQNNKKNLGENKSRSKH